jgi:phage-related protein
MANETILGRAKIPISGDLAQLDKDLSSARSKVGRAVDGIAANVKKVGAAAMVGVGIAAGAATAAVAGLGKLAIDAAPVEGLRLAFEGLATSSGQSMDELLAALQKGSSGMVSQRDLMMSYNQAAQLVGTTFANELPTAMGYLSKVSAATGQDMGFMLDSLVKGVGRLSPMILDNLGIQVSLEEATSRAAQMFGVEADALDKSQVQAGMMNVVLEKLAANTAAMPDVSDSAAAGLARMKATIQDTKDRIGLALLPVLNKFLGIVDKFLPYLQPVIDLFETRLVPILSLVADNFAAFFGALLEGQPVTSALALLFQDLLPADIIEGITSGLAGIVGWIQDLIAAVQPYVEQAAAWIAANVELQDVLIALGVAIAAIVVPALVSVVTAAAPILLVAAALIGAVALLRSAWENDFLGIRTFIEETLAKIKAWWAEHGDAIVAKATEIYQRIKDGIGVAIMVIRAVINRVLEQIKAWWAEHGDTIMTVARNAWDTIKTIVETVINTVKGIIDAVGLAIEGDWRGFGEKLREIWDNIWQAILRILGNAWANIKAVVGDLVRSILDFFRNVDWGALGKGIIQGIINGIKNGVGALIDAVKAAAQAALDAALGFLGIGSPSRVFEMQVALPSVQGWVRGLERGVGQIRAASAGLANASLMGAGAGEGLVTAGGGAMGYQINNYFGQDSVRSEDDIYRLAEQIDRSLALRGLQRVLD